MHTYPQAHTRTPLCSYGHCARSLRHCDGSGAPLIVPPSGGVVKHLVKRNDSKIVQHPVRLCAGVCVSLVVCVCVCVLLKLIDAIDWD